MLRFCFFFFFFLFGPNPELTDVISGGGKQSSALNREDSVESGENAVNNIYRGNHARSCYALDSQMVVTEGRKLSFLVVDYQQSIENLILICSACPCRNE